MTYFFKRLLNFGLCNCIILKFRNVEESSWGSVAVLWPHSFLVPIVIKAKVWLQFCGTTQRTDLSQVYSDMSAGCTGAMLA
jgi:hypothetical protein